MPGQFRISVPPHSTAVKPERVLPNRCKAPEPPSVFSPYSLGLHTSAQMPPLYRSSSSQVSSMAELLLPQAGKTVGNRRMD